MNKEQIRSVIAAGEAQCRSQMEIFDQLPPGSVTIRDLNSEVQRRMKPFDFATVGSVKRGVMRVWRQILLIKIRAAINQFPRRLKACIAARGGYFEHRF